MDDKTALVLALFAVIGVVAIVAVSRNRPQIISIGSPNQVTSQASAPSTNQTLNPTTLFIT